MATTIPYNPGSALVQSLISGTNTATVTSGSLPGTDKYSAAILHVKVAAIGGTSPTFDVYLQQLAPDGTTWYDIAAMAQISGNGSYYLAIISAGSSNFTGTTATLTAGTIRAVPFGGTQRVHVAVGGTSPTATLTVGIEYIE